MKYGFIGLGNMATAIIMGMLENGYDNRNIFGYDINEERRKLLKEENIRVEDNMKSLIRDVDMIILAVKPQNLSTILIDIKEETLNKNKKDKAIVTIAAGKKISFYNEYLPEFPIIRIMPNINATIGASTSALTFNEFASPLQIEKAKDIFSSIGLCFQIEEELFSCFSAIAAASPAFSYLYVDSLARAGVMHGLPRDIALEAAAHSTMASAQMILDKKNVHPMELVDKVTSPNGTTIRGIARLQENAFESAIHQAVSDTIKRDKEIGE